LQTATPNGLAFLGHAVEGGVRAYDVDVSVLLIQEDDGWWSAQCLEYDLAAQANNLTDLLYELEKTLISHIAANEAAGIDPFADIPAAPQTYWEMFNKAKLDVSGDRLPFRAPLLLRHRVSRRSMRVAERHAA
jgi:hypothetical protein